MKVLWLCNIMLPRICKVFSIDGSKKEGWISGLLENLLTVAQGPEIMVAFPMNAALLGEKKWMKGRIETETGKTLLYYGFLENTDAPWIYEEDLDRIFTEILKDAQPDIVHSFGTEYPHTLAAFKAFQKPERSLIGIQGLCSVYADAFYANIPLRIRNKKTFRDIVKKDTIVLQREKFVKRGAYEMEALKLAGHIAGRTRWDHFYAEKFHKEAQYHVLRETLRPMFYEGEWQYDLCEKHSIFVSQGDYPIKGLHYVLEAMPGILKEYPDAVVYVAGNNILRFGAMGKLKISAYGSYLMELIKKYDLTEKVIFLGSLSGEEMKEKYLQTNVYLCPSSIENSPNSLGEAMLLKTPIVTADVGGITSMISEKAGIIYEGYREEKEGELSRIVGALEMAVKKAFAMEGDVLSMTNEAKAEGERNHSGRDNVETLIALYEEMVR